MIDEELIKKKLEEIQDLINVELDVEDETLAEQLTCGDNWDDPHFLSKTLDKHPVKHAQWIYLKRTLRKEQKKIMEQFQTWVAAKKDELFSIIYNENIEAGQTPNTASPTQTVVENRFKSTYMVVDENGNYIDEEYIPWAIKIETIEDKLDIVEIIEKAFADRKDMLISMTSLLKSMMDNNLYIKKDRFNKSKYVDEDEL